MSEQIQPQENNETQLLISNQTQEITPISKSTPKPIKIKQETLTKIEYDDEEFISVTLNIDLEKAVEEYTDYLTALKSQRKTTVLTYKLWIIERKKEYLTNYINKINS